MITQALFNEIKLEAKTHSDAYLILKYEMQGISLTEKIVARIKEAKDYREFGDSNGIYN